MGGGLSPLLSLLFHRLAEVPPPVAVQAKEFIHKTPPFSTGSAGSPHRTICPVSLLSMANSRRVPLNTAAK